MPPLMAYFTRRQPTASSSSSGSSRQPMPHTKQQRQRRRQQQVGDYVLIRTIGRGSSGQVKLARHIITGEYVAIKMIARRHLLSSVAIARTVERELAILQLIQHPNLIILKHVLQDPTYVYFITEYVDGGELYHVLAEQGRLAETEARGLFIQLATAVAWCHTHHICHRDLKPENILIDRDKKKLKVADFGMATIQPSECLLKTSCGSPHYASPEIVTGKPYYGPPVDVWSCGVILYVLLTGRFPFDDGHVPRLLAKIKAGRHRKLPDYLSSSVKDLIRSMLTVDPNKRVTMNDVLCHPWVTTLSNDNVILRCRYDSAAPAVMFHQLENPVITSPDNLYGTVWETLKVLWRNMPRENIIAALLSDKPNVQKLTFWLLQKRTERLACGEESQEQERQIVDRNHQQMPRDSNSSSNNNNITLETNKELLNHHSLPIPFPSYRRIPLSLYDKVKLCCTNDYDGYDVLFLCHCLSNSSTMSSSNYTSEKSQKQHQKQQQQNLVRRSMNFSASYHDEVELSPSTAVDYPPDFVMFDGQSTRTMTTDSSSVSTPSGNHCCDELASAVCGCDIDSYQQLQQKEERSIANAAPIGSHHLPSSAIRQKRASSIINNTFYGSNMFTNHSTRPSHLKSTTAEAIVSHVIPVAEHRMAITSFQLKSTHQQQKRQHNNTGLFKRPFRLICNLHQELFQPSSPSSSFEKTVAAATATTIDDLKTTAATIKSKNICAPQRAENRYLTMVNKKLHRWLFYTLMWLDEKVLYGWEVSQQNQQSNEYDVHKIYTIDCAADHEGEAAGKLQQLLSQYLGGDLNGHLYPSGQIIWSGSMLAANPTDFLTKQDRQLEFLCNITILKNTFNDDTIATTESSSRSTSNNMYSSTLKTLARFHFILIQGEPYFMRSTVNTLNQLFESHETQAKLVSEANGWLL
ncbi:hypothetical protein BDB00DRAFT_809035 [Zychaea mexicana]|uniref:uncharacterized protein n=1 Tax=Zychaea mexicana TaxID=64656 RepID=UPI0022FEE62D|nr:uncharacterized protein BDB00DRAFT_809035 [Zychaea mexicana]KAI9496480.1 hypothetical protein BDB00DRAFT_809035 [Zychaea mexicana]